MLYCVSGCFLISVCFLVVFYWFFSFFFRSKSGSFYPIFYITIKFLCATALLFVGFLKNYLVVW